MKGIKIDKEMDELLKQVKGSIKFKGSAVDLLKQIRKETSRR